MGRPPESCILLCDEKITRMMAETEGIRPLGTLGILLRAMRQRLITPTEAKRLLDALIQAHGFRIGVEVYRAALSEIERHSQPGLFTIPA